MQQLDEDYLTPISVSEKTRCVANYNKVIRLLTEIWTFSKISDVIEHICRNCLELTGADQVTIFLFDPAQQLDAKTLIRKGDDKHLLLDNYLNRLLGGWVTRNRRALCCGNLESHFGMENISSRYREISSVIAVPLAVDETIIGVINLVVGKSGKLLDKLDLHLIEMLAPHCAQFIRNAHLQEEMFSETNRLKQALREKYDFEELVGRSRKMQAVFTLLENVMPTDVRVLIHGESGTGKERIARILHFNGPRKNAPFVAVDCAALPAALLESELFGYVKGAFTGADRHHKGLFAEANGGTIFLDEIGNMSTPLQAKLLRVLQEEEIRPVGDSKTHKIDVRVIAATSADLRTAMDNGTFRQDLFYRLNIINIHLPPLRERIADIAVLAHHFLKHFTKKYGKTVLGLTANCIALLERHHWPGNVRELEHALERAVILCPSDYLTECDFPEQQQTALHPDALFQPRPLQNATVDFKKLFIEAVLQQTGGSQIKAAKILQIQRTYLNRLIKELNIR